MENSLKRQGAGGVQRPVHRGKQQYPTQPKTDMGGGVREPESLNLIPGEGYQQIWRPYAPGLRFVADPQGPKVHSCIDLQRSNNVVAGTAANTLPWKRTSLACGRDSHCTAL